MQSPDGPINEALLFCDLVFDSLLHQNNPQQLLSIVFVKLRQLLNIDLFCLLWPITRNGVPEWEHAGLGEKTIRLSLLEKLDEKRSQKEPSPFSPHTSFYDFAFSNAETPYTVIPCKQLLPKASSIKHLHYIQLNEEEKPFGYLFLGTEKSNNALSGNKTQWRKLGKRLLNIVKASIFDSQREERFLQVSIAYSQLLDDYAEMGEAHRALEKEIQRFSPMEGMMNSAFHLIKKLRDMKPGHAYMSDFFYAIKKMTTCELACFAFLNEGSFQLIYQNEESDIVKLEFSELDGGIYHDVIFSDIPHYWDGVLPREFLLPSGHPNISDSLFIPVRDIDDNEGVFMLANSQTEEMTLHIQTLVTSLLRLEADHLIQSVTTD